MRLRALLFVLLSGAPAAAGEIPTPVVITTEQTPGNPSPGPLTFTFDSPGTLPLTPGVPTQIGTVTLGRGPGWNGTQEDYWAYTFGSVSVKVTDSASGWFGTLTIPVVGYDYWMYRAWDGRILENQYLILGDAWGTNPASDSVVLKGWRYTLTAAPNDYRDTATFTLMTEPVHTPEPATLALGLIGAIPLGLRKMRRG
ncbi:hypothetical protein J0H58_02315 [bacterium]|nr:hypothetical protein [bacterium]